MKVNWKKKTLWAILHDIICKTIFKDEKNWFCTRKSFKKLKGILKSLQGLKIPAGHWLTTPALEIYFAGAYAINNIILLYIKDRLL